MALLKRWRVGLLLALLTLVPVWRGVLGGETLGPWGQIRQMAPWRAAPPAAPFDVLQADAVLEFYGWREQVLRAWGAGRLPLWNPSELGGAPLLANSQAGGFYPPHIALGLLRVPTPWAIAFLAWVHLWWAALGVYALCRRLGASELGALVGGAGFGLSPFLCAWVALGSVGETVAWIPWGIVATLALPRGRSVAALAVCAACMFLAGHLQFAAYGALAWLVAAGFRFSGGERARTAVAFVSAMALGAALAAPQLLPVFEHGRHSDRQTRPTWDGFVAYSAGALPAWQLASVPDASLLGVPTQPIVSLPAPVAGFWPALIQRGGNFAESAIGLTPTLFVLMLAGGAAGLRRARAAVAIGALGLLLATGSLVGAALYFLAPGWPATGSPGRAGVLFVLGACVVAGCAFAEGQAAPKLGRPTVLVWGASLAAAFVVLFVPARSAWLPGLSASDVATAIDAPTLVVRGFGLAIAALALARGWARAPRFAPAWAAGLVALGAFPGALLVPFSASRLPPVDAGPRSARIAVVQDGWGLLQAAPALLPPNTAELFGLKELGGYDSIVDRRTRDRLAEIDGEDPAPAANGNMMFIKPNANPALLAASGVTQVWSLRPLPALAAQAPDSDGVYRYPLPGPGRASTPAGPATIMADGPDRLELEATGPGPLVVRDFLYEGWSARVDGRPVPLRRSPLPTVELAAGSHRVSLVYSPPGLVPGEVACAVGLAVIALLLIKPAIGPRQSPA